MQALKHQKCWTIGGGPGVPEHAAPGAILQWASGEHFFCILGLDFEENVMLKVENVDLQPAWGRGLHPIPLTPAPLAGYRPPFGHKGSQLRSLSLQNRQRAAGQRSDKSKSLSVCRNQIQKRLGGGRGVG